MNKISVLAMLAFCFTNAHAYYSKDSTEATVTFNAFAEIQDLYSDQNILEYAIPPQLDYLAGSMQPEWDELFRNNGVAQSVSSPKRDQQIRIIRRFKDPKTGKSMAEYQYTGTFVVGNKIPSTMTLSLPYDPSSILAPEISNGNCFVLGDAYRVAFYLKPQRPGCNLVEGRDYFKFQASVSRLPNTKSTFPRYENLEQNGEIRMILSFGAEEDMYGYFSPGTSAVSEHDKAAAIAAGKDPKSVRARVDFNSQGYLEVRKYLSREGFSGPVKIEQAVREQECGSTFGRAGGFVEEFTRQDSGRKIVVRLFWGVADMGSESNAFYCIMKEAAERGAVFLYSGHSRVGLLTLEYVSQLFGQNIMPANRYQIYGFLGCSGYGHYTLSYLDRKRTSSDPTGTQNTDIITNGIFGNFEEMGGMNTRTIGPILQWSKSGAKSSWQQIINSYNKTYLTGVNGDE